MLTTIEGRGVAYESDGEGVPLLLLHAFPLDQTMFEEQREGLSDVARVITFDAPGVGRSEPSALSMEALADVAAQLLDALEIERAVVGGVSMGGYAALAFARRHPQRLLGLILANTRPAADTDEARENRRRLARTALEQGSTEIAERMLPKLLTESTRRERLDLVNRVRAMIEAMPPDTIAALLAALAERQDSTSLLSSISVPTLVVHSEADAIIPPEEAVAYANEISGATYAEAAGAGHLANLERPGDFNRIVRDFIESLGSREPS